MTRINAGSVLANQYAPPFVVSNNVTTNWQLRWNADLIAFEAFDPSENAVAAGFDSIQQALFSNTNNQQVFVVPWGIDPTLSQLDQKATLYLTINGVKQHSSEYTVATGVNSTTITLNGATGTNDDVEVIGMQATGGAIIDINTFLGDGNPNQAVVLDWLAPSEQSLLITIEGLKQETDQYSISSNAGFTATTVTFVGTIPLNDSIEIVGITTTGETPASPVNGANLGVGGEGIFGAKRQVGENQILDFKSLVAGARIELTSDANLITIAADDITFTNTGSGETTTNNATTVDFGLGESLEFKTLVAGNRVNIVASGGAGSEILTWTVDEGYVKNSSSPIANATTGDRLIGIANTAAPLTLNLLPIAELPAGDTITIKDETGGAAANNITVTPSSELIDGSGTYVINTNYGYVTLYSDGTNYFVIAQG
jgi:hypothetical protein